jgi:hypothetical protein
LLLALDCVESLWILSQTCYWDILIAQKQIIGRETFMTQTPYPIARDSKLALTVWQTDSGPRAIRMSEAEEISQTLIHLSQEAIAGPYTDQESAKQGLFSLMGSRDFNDGALKIVPRFQPALTKQTNTKPIPDQRWPALPKHSTIWMIEIIFWKIGHKSEPQWERLRQRQKLETMMTEPMVAKKKQKALDFGLFEFIPPDDPDIIIPDE